MIPLTAAQASAMFALIQGHALCKLIRAGKRTSDGWEGLGGDEWRPWCVTVNAIAVQRLERAGYAHSVTVHVYADQYETRYKATVNGLRAWGAATANERYGLPEWARLGTETAESAQ